MGEAICTQSMRGQCHQVCRSSMWKSSEHKGCHQPTYEVYQVKSKDWFDLLINECPASITEYSFYINKTCLPLIFLSSLLTINIVELPIQVERSISQLLEHLFIKGADFVITPSQDSREKRKRVWFGSLHHNSLLITAQLLHSRIFGPGIDRYLIEAINYYHYHFSYLIKRNSPYRYPPSHS